MKKLSFDTWKNIFRNLDEMGEEVEIVWLDTDDEWALVSGEELFEDGFESEQAAQSRLTYLENEIL